MTSSETNPRVPGVTSRLAARVRPVGNPVMYQEWRDLLFVHWEYSVAAIQATLPDGLFVDTFGGKAYESVRSGDSGRRCVFEYAPGNAWSEPPPESLEFFLVERYRLYSSAPDGLRRGAVFHEPYPVCRAELTAWDENLLPLNGFSPTGRPPDHVLRSRGVDVTVFPLERLGNG